MLRRIDQLLFDASGRVIGRERLQAVGPVRGGELREGVWRSLVALEPHSVIFELKQGPYQPTADKDFLPGFPLEGSSAALAQERSWRDLFEAAERIEEVSRG